MHPTNCNTPMLVNEGEFKIFRPDLEHPTLEQVLPSFASAHLLGEPWVEPEDVNSAPVRRDRRITLLARGATTELSGLSAETDATVRSGKD